MFPVYGFGAKFQKIEGACHFFALNGDIFRPEVHSLAGVEAVYKNALQKVSLCGPTNLAEIIRKTNACCQNGSLEES